MIGVYYWSIEGLSFGCFFSLFTSRATDKTVDNVFLFCHIIFSSSTNKVLTEKIFFSEFLAFGKDFW